MQQLAPVEPISILRRKELITCARSGRSGNNVKMLCIKKYIRLMITFGCRE